MSESFGKEIQARRTAIGMSQGRLAELVGRSSSTVRAWEKGRTVPSPASLDALKAVLGLSDQDEETVIEMPAIVAGVAPDSYKPEPTSAAATVLRGSEEVKQREFEQALQETEFFDVKVEAEPEEEAELESGEVEAPLASAESVILPLPHGVQSTEATVSFVDQPTGSIRYIARIVATLVVLGGMGIVGKWAASGALDIVKGVWGSIRAAFGSSCFKPERMISRTTSGRLRRI